MFKDDLSSLAGPYNMKSADPGTAGKTNAMTMAWATAPGDTKKKGRDPDDGTASGHDDAGGDVDLTMDTMDFAIAVRLRSNKKVQNLSKMCYKFFRQPLVAQGDFGHEFS